MTRRLLTVVSLTIMIVHSGQAQDAATQDRIGRLEAAVEQLLQQNAELQDQIDQLRGEQETAVPEAAPATEPAVPETPPEATASSLYGDRDVRPYWNNGLKFESGDRKTFKGAIGGRLQLDTAAYEESDDIPSITSGVEIRRARFYTQGEFQTSVPVFYKFQYDLADEDINFADLYIGLNKLPYVGKLTVGHMKRPMGLDQLTSSRFTTLMERSAPTEAFNQFRDTGVKISNTAFDERMTWAAGYFVSVDSLTASSDTDTGNSVIGRVTGLPFYENDGERLIHLGVSGQVGSTGENDAGEREIQIRTRPESHLSPRLIDTGAIPAERGYLLAAEAAAVFGPFSAQGEFYYVGLDVPSGQDPDYYGFYVQGSYFLTGEHKKYKTSDGAFDRLSPVKNFSLEEDGIGAWEVALRYSYTDLTDDTYNGGEMGIIMAGLNWYLNPNTRAMFNYGLASVDETANEGDLHIFQTRVQVDF